ncbi:MAG: cytochrome c biogenesis protein CcdA, partial [Actinomycetales bacterium]|nr:cytochrome c biogenesis protein CcdA [Actinomycetales bacterium]
FMGGITWLQFDRRPHRWSATGVAGAVVLGVAFGLGWSPCIGPALAAVQALAFAQGTAARGTLLSAAYCIGLGLPFLLLALLGQRAAGGLRFLRRHIRAINIVGGAMLVLLGVLLLTGAWADVLAWMQSHAPQWTPPW